MPDEVMLVANRDQVHDAARNGSPAPPVRFDEIVVTSDLARRPTRPPQHAAENRALRDLAQQLTHAPHGVLQKLVDLALDLCRAGSAGISLLEQEAGCEIFRWHAVAGPWRALAATTTVERDYSACGAVLAQNAALLLDRPLRHFTRFAGLTPEPIETLLVPFHVGGQPVGTLWVVAHDEQRKFDREDQRLLESLATFAATAYQVLTSLDAAEQRGRLAADSERRFRDMIDVLPVAIYTTDADGRLTHFNPAAVELSGRTPELGSDRWCVSFKLYRPDGTPLPHDQCPMSLALRECRAIRGEEIIAERPDGARVWVAPYPTPLCDSEGRVVGGINMLLDISDRKQADETRARLAAIVASSDDAIISKTLDGIITSWNDSAMRLFGYTAAEAIGRPVLMLIPSERHDEETTILDRLKRGQRVDHFETVRVAKDGHRLDISLTTSPVRDPSGRVVGASKTARDITARKRDEARLRTLMAELNHRVKNTLATIDALAQHTLRRATCLADFGKSFSARLRSMAAAHSLLTQSEWQGADLRRILVAELAERVAAPERLSLEGPALLLAPKAALALHMAVHELATNASKYGSLSVPDGRLCVCWRIAGPADGQRVELDWQERGGPPAIEPRETGYGSEMIADVVEYELSGAVERRFEHAGLRCRISFPLEGVAEVGDRSGESTTKTQRHEEEEVTKSRSDGVTK